MDYRTSGLKREHRDLLQAGTQALNRVLNNASKQTSTRTAGKHLQFREGAMLMEGEGGVVRGTDLARDANLDPSYFPKRGRGDKYQ